MGQLAAVFALTHNPRIFWNAEGAAPEAARVVRETPLHAGHLRTMHELALMGAIILPPVPAFYHRPRTIEDLIAHSVGKALDQLGVEHDLFRRWTGPVSPEDQ